MSPQITELWAYVISDPSPGDPQDEGVPAFYEGGMWFPLLGADKERATSMRERAEEIARDTGKQIKLIRSTGIEVVELIEGR